MPKQFEKGLFVFHRDLRIVDNAGLVNAMMLCEKVYTCFVGTPEQLGNKNAFRSENAIRFMFESLEHLSGEIHRAGGELLFLYGDPTSVIGDAVVRLGVSAVFTNKDYTPYAVERDERLSKWCASKKIEYMESADYYLFEPGSITTTTGKPFQKYTPFYDAVIQLRVPAPYPTYRRLTETLEPAPHGVSIPHTTTLAKFKSKFGESRVPIHGGRAEGLAKLAHAVKHQRKYDDERDFLDYETTGLSAYIKFGCVSVREVYREFVRAYGKKSGLVRELIWREFFAHVLYGFPDALKGYTKRDVPWRHSKRDFQLWKKGQTGFPVVDAAMRQLNATGFMHNRGRMIVANFLVKTLLIDWRWGEAYFAQQLTDYDVASNNGNWQSISATGVDQKPYFRDMNPWIQSAKFDPDAAYIKHWVPELAAVPPIEIHKWDVFSSDPKHRATKYPKPMVSYPEQKERMLAMYRR